MLTAKLLLANQCPAVWLMTRSEAPQGAVTHAPWSLVDAMPLVPLTGEVYIPQGSCLQLQLSGGMSFCML